MSTQAEKPDLQPTDTPANRGGAPEGNRNRMTWGGRGWAAIGSYPKGGAWVRRQVGRLRAELESAVLDSRGQFGVYESALSQSACRHEGRALLLTRWLKIEADKLGMSERLALLKEIGNATDSRDKCLQRLGLDAKRDESPWSALDARYGVVEDDGPEHGEEQQRAAHATCGAVSKEESNGTASESQTTANATELGPSAELSDTSGK